MIYKKGDGSFLGEIGGLLIALLGLIIVGAIIYRFFAIGTAQESENAKQTLTSIASKLSALPDEANTSFAFQGFSENAWFLVGWNGNDRMKPGRCGLDASKGCICICPGTGDADACQKKGFCQVVNQQTALVHTLPSSIVGYDGILIVHRGCIPLPSNLFELFAVKSEDSVSLTLASLNSDNKVNPSNRLNNCPIEVSPDRYSSPQQG